MTLEYLLGLYQVLGLSLNLNEPSLASAPVSLWNSFSAASYPFLPPTLLIFFTCS